MATATHLKVTRYRTTEHSTSGILSLNDVFEAFTLEDPPGQCIPAGFYVLGWQDLNTPLTKRYKAKFSWFSKHLHIKEVPGYTSVYCHLGNFPKDTKGCLLVGQTAHKDQIGSSRLAYEQLYDKLESKLNDGEIVIMEIV